MITVADMATAPAILAPPTQVQAGSLRERILLLVLFTTVLASSVAFIEPSPHDALMGVLAVACLIAGVRFDRILVLPFLLLLIWNFAGMMSLLNVPDSERAIQYTGTSVYLAIAAILFACLFAQNTMPRLTAMRIAYVLTALFAAVAGISGYLHLFPGAEQMFVRYDRALGPFKDPNVYGPFLIWPTLFLLHRMVAHRIRFLDIVVTGILLFALLLSFSRGAWFHFAVSAAVLVALAFLTAATSRARMRVFGLTAVTVVAFAAFIAVLLSFDTIGEMFRERAQLIQYYDVGPGGRFHLQELALSAVLNFPNGVGPFEFSRMYGLQQHNVYLQAFMVYGWIGAMAYVLLLLSTLFFGLRTAFTQSPWQAYCVTALAAFAGEMAEGFVIDTDHWRHFYLMLGIIWGLTAATISAHRRKAALRLAMTPN